MAVSGFAVLVHCKSCLADGIAGRGLGRIFGVALVERNHGVAVVKFPCCAVNVFFIVCLVADEGTFVDGKRLFRSGENILGDGGVMNIGGRRQFIERQARVAINKDMILVAPVELVIRCAGLTRYGRRGRNPDRLLGGCPC